MCKAASPSPLPMKHLPCGYRSRRMSSWTPAKSSSPSSTASARSALPFLLSRPSLFTAPPLPTSPLLLVPADVVFCRFPPLGLSRPPHQANPAPSASTRVNIFASDLNRNAPPTAETTLRSQQPVLCQLGHRCLPKRGAIHKLDQPVFILLPEASEPQSLQGGSELRRMSRDSEACEPERAFRAAALAAVRNKGVTISSGRVFMINTI